MKGKKDRTAFEKAFNKQGSANGILFGAWGGKDGAGHPTFTYTHKGVTYKGSTGGTTRKDPGREGEGRARNAAHRLRELGRI